MWAPSLTRSRVCNSQFFWPLTAHPVSGLLRFSQPGGLGSSTYFSQKQVVQLHPWALGSKLKLKLIYYRRSVCQSGSPSLVRPNLEPTTRVLFSVWQMRFLDVGVPSLTRGWICNLLVQLHLGLARAVTLMSKSSRTDNKMFCLIWDSPKLGASGSCICIRRKQGSLVSSSSIYFATDSQSACSSWCRVPFGAHDQVLIFFLWQFFLIHVRRPPWREDGSAVCSAITQWSESRITCNHTLLSHLRLPQPGQPGPHICILQK
jgi:hypothetical protein